MSYKFLRSRYLLIGILSGFLLGGSWLAWAAIQSQVGINVANLPTLDPARPTWTPLINPSSAVSMGTFDNVLATSNVLSTSGSPSLLSSWSFGGVSINRANVAAAGLTLAINNTGVPDTALPTTQSDAYTEPCALLSCVHVPVVSWLYDGTNQVRSRSISATNLSATTSLGANLNVPLSTWSVTNTPAAATQATASRAAGGGTVRHVATTITACSAQAGTAQTPIAINLRDGATGAGTILRTWKVSSVINDSKCVEASGLAMIGTANTAMTLEFAAAGVAASEQTVTLTGFSVP